MSNFNEFQSLAVNDPRPRNDEPRMNRRTVMTCHPGERGRACMSALYIYIVIIFIVPVLRKTVGSNALALDWLSSRASNAILGGSALGSTSKARRRAGIHMHEIRSHTD